jgi:hypothetical protein
MLSPPGVGGDVTEPQTTKKILGRNAALFGGHDQSNILDTGSPKAIRKHVHWLFSASECTY